MNPKQYTDDAVCFAMGLGQLAPNTHEPVVRLLCKPSFHPEVCVTLTVREIVTTALRSSLVQEPIPARMPELSERASLPVGEFERICAMLDQALAESKLPPKWVVICDGMATSAVRIRAGQLECYSGHAVNEKEREFVKSLLSLALSRTTVIPLRNRLSWCGQYVSPRDEHTFPTAPEPDLPQPRVSRLLVMGSPEERAEFHSMFGAKDTPRHPT